jgi:Tfp pilus assembly protein PilE
MERGSEFRIIWLMLVVVIIGIISALVIPHILEPSPQVKQAGAKTLLKHVYTLERDYWQKNGRYTHSMEALGVEVPDDLHCTLILDSHGDSGFTATVIVNIDDDPTVDEWIVTENGRVKCVTNDVTQ